MLFLSALTFVAAAARLAVAQTGANNTELGIEAIEAHFQQADIARAPGAFSSDSFLLAVFRPTALLNVSFDGVGQITPGQALSQDQVQPTPQVTVTPANSSFSLNSSYTLMMVDAGPVGTADAQVNQTRHWLVNGVTIGSDGSISNTSATTPTSYAGPAPPAGTGPHRYVVLLYAQPANFSSPADAGTGVVQFMLEHYVEETGLGDPVAGMYLTVENGAASVSLSATSAVVSSTLPAADSTASGSHSATVSSPSSTGGSSKSGAVSLSASALSCGAFAALAGLAAFF